MVRLRADGVKKRGRIARLDGESNPLHLTVAARPLPVPHTTIRAILSAECVPTSVSLRKERLGVVARVAAIEQLL